MKNKIVLFVTGCCVLLLSSCLDSDNGTSIEIAPNCQLASFSLKSDSIKGLSSTNFTIDQLNGRIFNSDSMPYGTVFDEKVTATINYMSSIAVSGMQVYQTAKGDTLWWSGSDSLDFSQPVYFKVMAYDGMNSKEYKAWVNIHQVEPDSMSWGLYASKLFEEEVKEQKVISYAPAKEETGYYYMYTSAADASKGYGLYKTAVTDVKSWEKLPLTGLPAANVRISQITEYNGNFYVPTTEGVLYVSANGQDWTAVEEAPSVKYLFGVVKKGEKQPSVLTAAVEVEDGLHYAAMNEKNEWTTGGAVQPSFPLTGFGVSTYAAMYHEYLMVVAGRDKENKLTRYSWATMDGLNWALLSDEDRESFCAREGVMVTPYDDKLFLIGGMDASGKVYKDMYTSTDYGVTWSKSDTLVVMPTDYAARAFSSVQVDKDNFMFIFGGKTAKNTNEQQQVWRGRINRLGFKK